MGIETTIELCDDPRLAHALLGLEAWTHVWVLFWFHRVENWRAKVQPPRDTARRGVLATRSPHRPNPIGLTAARLLRVAGHTVVLEGLDLLDGTPILDLKPYVPYADRIDDASTGWLPEGTWEVELSSLAAAQLAFLESGGVPLREELLRALEPGPVPHPARRLRCDGPNGTIAVKEWRAEFVVADGVITVGSVMSGYSRADLAARPLDLALHHAFEARWPRPTCAG